MSPDSRDRRCCQHPLRILDWFVTILIVLGTSTACSAESSSNGPTYGKGTQVFGVRLGIDGLSDVVKQLGPAEIRKVGDASTSRSVVCYVASLPAQDVVVSFSSDSELHGAPDFLVTNIEIAPADEGEKGRCGEIGDKRSGSPYSPSLIGRSRAAVLLDLDIAQEAADPTVRLSRCEEVSLPRSSEKYGYWSERRDDCFKGKAPYLDACSTLTLVFSGDRLDSITLSYVESIC